MILSGKTEQQVIVDGSSQVNGVVQRVTWLWKVSRENQTLMMFVA